MPYKPAIKLTQKQIALLSRRDLTNEEIGKAIGRSPVTICRLRKKHGIEIPRGRKKGKLITSRETRQCVHCRNQFEVISTSVQRYCSADCWRNSEEHARIQANADKSYMQTEEYRSTLRNPNLTELQRYRSEVWRLTKKTYQQYEKEINPHGLKRGLAGQSGVYHLDHIISIKRGFDENIPPHVLAEKTNLRLIPWKENISKGSK